MGSNMFLSVWSDDGCYIKRSDGIRGVEKFSRRHPGCTIELMDDTERQRQEIEKTWRKDNVRWKMLTKVRGGSDDEPQAAAADNKREKSKTAYSGQIDCPRENIDMENRRSLANKETIQTLCERVLEEKLSISTLVDIFTSWEKNLDKDQLRIGFDQYSRIYVHFEYESKEWTSTIEKSFHYHILTGRYEGRQSSLVINEESAVLIGHVIRLLPDLNPDKEKLTDFTYKSENGRIELRLKDHEKKVSVGVFFEYGTPIGFVNRRIYSLKKIEEIIAKLDK
ncbi:hypothetical protein PROFUN_11069 [Planoprotostelium fungivorum]|uniref:Uncharacterized protein n=1 Tax=Planoprotostelium fungivorum TaxID=1890364 RepID=A0A2P6NBR9_9EUKA|nr:hypothetical protein PROFUN_11069 [Planoprotostelium fungivorum]